MTILPIVERELRLRARRPGLLRVRMGAALISFLIVAALFLFSWSFVSPGQIGKAMFSFLTILAFIGCLLEGVRVTADCLSEEKRQGTLGLLFLTDLRAYDVVLGKFLAVSLTSIYGLLAILPAMAVPITLGGVTGSEFWRVVLVLVTTLFFSLSVGMLVSTVSYRERHAWLATFLAVLAAAVVPWIAATLSPGQLNWAAMVSPTVALTHAYEAGYTRQGHLFWMAIGCLNAYGSLCLVLSCHLLPKTWQAPGLTARMARRVAHRPPPPPTEGVQWRPGYRSPRYEANPLAWLVGRGRNDSWGMRWVVAVVGVGSLACWGATGFDPRLGIAMLLIALGLHLFLASWVGVEACTTMAGARDSGLLELLLTTPMSAPQIVRGYQDGLWRFFARPVLLMVSLDLVGLGFYFARMLSDAKDAGDLLGLVFLNGLLLGLTLLDLVAAGSYGLWMGLVMRKPSQAITRTLLYAVWLPALGLVCCPILFGVLKNAVLINFGADRLLKRLRPIVTSWYTGEEAAPPAVPPLRIKKPPPRELPSVLPPGG